MNPSTTIDSLGVWDGHDWHWLIPWRRELRPRDIEEKEAMFNLLKSVTLDVSREDYQDLVLLRMCWWLKAWEDDFPYSPNEVIHNPKCLNWKKSVAPRISSQQHIPQIWSPPSIKTLMWNVDASFKPHLDHAAVGGVLRNPMGNFVCLFSSPIPLLEINYAEVFAIFRAIKISINSDRIKNHRIIIISDSSNAVQWCNQDSGGPWNLSFMLNFIRNARKQWLTLSIIHKVRATNGVADSLAKQGLSRRDEFLAWL
ncbi:uncharacterized protein LOC104884533 [Beta vulgaris subsp. vulgaris]|uniref:uncharacterized protein LOC104884533 n=1 Tax=Beta vulgaris subsp. vulgaris TaxID=3555 RepID=UPI00053FE48B|nr:uncharacterized protein LOC104884533 [Beta vulgaris subsp. vulgaris]